MSRGRKDSGSVPAISELNERSRHIFREIVEAYVSTGAPIGSHTLSRRLPMSLSPATIRNVMADLEDLGLLYAPHISAGRLPTPLGMRMFVNGLLEVGGLPDSERSAIDAQCRAAGKSLEHVLAEATLTLSGLSRCAGLVVAPQMKRSLKHMEFVSLGDSRALVVLVTEDGLVENRILNLPAGVSVSTLNEASNFLNHRAKAGRTLEDIRDEVFADLEDQRTQLDLLTQKVVQAGLASWGDEAKSSLIVRGQSHLLDDITAVEDLERIRTLFQALETSEQFLQLVDITREADGVQIFIGAENELFGVTNCSMIVSPYRNSRQQIVGAIGVIGPQRLNFARIIPMVDYTARVVGRLIG